MSRLPWVVVLVRHLAVCVVLAFRGPEEEFQAALSRFQEHLGQ